MQGKEGASACLREENAEAKLKEGKGRGRGGWVQAAGSHESKSNGMHACMHKDR